LSWGDENDTVWMGSKLHVTSASIGTVASLIIHPLAFCFSLLQHHAFQPIIYTHYDTTIYHVQSSHPRSFCLYNRNVPGKPSQRVHEIRAFITQQLNLTVIQPFDPLITLSATALAVLATQQQILHDRATKEEQDQIAHHHTVAG
jgi:hypothetical protein